MPEQTFLAEPMGGDTTRQRPFNQPVPILQRSYSNATRPTPAAAIARGWIAGTPIWNTDDVAPNYLDVVGGQWVDAMGMPT
jgi:hypothetical protein